MKIKSIVCTIYVYYCRKNLYIFVEANKKRLRNLKNK